MCNYKYQTPHFKAKSATCYLANIFQKHNILEVKNYSLPVDKDNLCLFHSTDKSFKAEHDFNHVLLKFIEYCNSSRKMEFIDLRGVIIDSKDGFTLKELTTTKELNLCAAKVTCPFFIENCHFNGDVFMDRIIMTNTFSIENTVVTGNFTAIEGAGFNKNVNFQEVVFHDLFDVRNAYFMNQVNLNPVEFRGHTIFDAAAFRGQNSFIYLKVKVTHLAEFNETIFDGPVQFEDCVFDGDTVFHGTKFNDPLYFAKPTINATVYFKGIDEAHKIFNTGIDMEISEDSFVDSGQIIFQNANLIFLDGKTKTQLTYLEKNRRIVLGEGTIVFRFSFQEKYPFSALDEIFLMDLLTKIKQYFDYELNKHFEFTMVKEGDEIIVTFFTDDYTNQNDFQVEQFKSVQKLLNSTKENDVKSATETYLSKHLTDIVNDGIKNYTDKHIHLETLLKSVTIENLTLHVANSPIQEIKSIYLSTPRIDNTSITIDVLKIENDPVFNLSTTQFNQLKQQILNANLENEDLQFIKTELAKIKKDTGALIVLEGEEQQLKDFLLEKGINVGDNLIASTVFLFLSKLIFGV